MKAIITDLDRTLLHTDKSVSEYTVEVLNKCRESGILIMAASARPLRTIQVYQNLLIETNKGLYSNRDIPIWKPVVYDKFPLLPDGTILYKILASSGQKPLYENIEKVLSPDVYHSVADGSLIQIMSREATKWNGIKHMLSQFHIFPGEAIYFGDDNDDIEPVRNCGLGVAVSNAIPSVLDVADCVAESNDQDGVAKFLEKEAPFLFTGSPAT